MVIVIDTRIKRFIEGYVVGENEDIIAIKLNDIGETFWFDDKTKVQEFLNEQVTERIYDKELRKGYFDYVDEYGTNHRYYINKLVKGKITTYNEEIVML